MQQRQRAKDGKYWSNRRCRFINDSMQKLLLSIALLLVLSLFQEQTLGQDIDRYTKVANHLVELVNKENYSGIQALFSKEMGEALPLEKSTAFFKGVEQQYGKIQKLDP